MSKQITLAQADLHHRIQRQERLILKYGGHLLTCNLLEKSPCSCGWSTVKEMAQGDAIESFLQADLPPELLRRRTLDFPLVKRIIEERDGLRVDLADIAKQLGAHPDSKLTGENGLAAATKRGRDAREAAEDRADAAEAVIDSLRSAAACLVPLISKGQLDRIESEQPCEYWNVAKLVAAARYALLLNAMLRESGSGGA